MTTFNGFEYRSHTSCMSEAQKYQGSLYKNNNKKQRLNNSKDIATPSRATPQSVDMAAVQIPPVPEHLRQYQAVESSYYTPVAPVPRSVSVTEEKKEVNVFDYFVGQATPTASTVSRDNELVRFRNVDDDDNDTVLPEPADIVLPDATEAGPRLPPVPEAPVMSYETPAPKPHKSSKHREPGSKTDKKRKRPHVDSIDTSIANTPGLHTGLSVNMKHLMRSNLPPSPELSGGDTSGNSPSSPLKKSKQHPGIFDTLMGTIKPKHKSKEASESPKSSKTHSPKTKTKSKSKAKEPTKKTTSHRHHQKTAAKLLEYNKEHDKKSDKNVANEGQIVLFNNSCARTFLGILEQTDNDHGYSMNKALKRYHREISKDKGKPQKALEDKELFKSLRLRRNDRGEIVLFVPDEE
ncbi:hypothetical protein BROUX41_004816 [Berkeleyomyces rouxiae]|uniref:uncharacterized protein n=1 Tax=Berkeleyomyces rouxiae TaxID=2035830 RepID=UPI003B784549